MLLCHVKTTFEIALASFIWPKSNKMNVSPPHTQPGPSFTDKGDILPSSCPQSHTANF
jgi:hypothetical protein